MIYFLLLCVSASLTDSLILVQIFNLPVKLYHTRVQLELYFSMTKKKYNASTWNIYWYTYIIVQTTAFLTTNILWIQLDTYLIIFNRTKKHIHICCINNLYASGDVPWILSVVKKNITNDYRFIIILLLSCPLSLIFDQMRVNFTARTGVRSAIDFTKPDVCSYTHRLSFVAMSTVRASYTVWC